MRTNVTHDAIPRDLETAYTNRDVEFIRARIHELADQISEEQDHAEFHKAAAKLYVAIALFDSLQAGYGVTTLMTDYLNI